MKMSKDRLRKFLFDEYIKRGGASNIGTAIRDCLTDLSHLNTETTDDQPLHWRLVAAEEVAEQERLEADRQDQETEPKKIYKNIRKKDYLKKS